MTDESSQADEREFDFLMARAGIAIPADRRAGTLKGFVEIRAHVRRLWELKTEAEPMPIFKLKPVSERKK
jgi:hypothetical protein